MRPLFIFFVLILFSSCGPYSYWDSTAMSDIFNQKRAQSYEKEVPKEATKENFFSQEEFIALEDDDDTLEEHIPLAKEEAHYHLSQFIVPSHELHAVFKNISFGFDNHRVTDGIAKAQLKKITKHLHKHPDQLLYIEGHCDARGPEDYNLALGSRRAQGVRVHLINEGISPSRIFIISYGKGKLLDNAHHASAHSKNRRVQFKLLNTTS